MNSDQDFKTTTMTKTTNKPEIFLVGGIVRDELLGIESNDIDFTFVLPNLDKTVEEGFAIMTKHLEDNKFKIFLSTPDCFTIRAMFPEDHEHKGTVADFVMARKESGHIKGTRLAEFELGTLEDDLLRRDFTVNAMAKALDGTIIDPFGGTSDLSEMILDTPRDPMLTMIDDPLRMLRAIRFSITKDMMIHPRVEKAMAQPELIDRLKETVSTERIREELSKAFKHDTLKTMRVLSEIDKELPGFLEACFPPEITLLPSMKTIKR